MLIFGNEYIESPHFITISTVEEIDATTPKDILYLQEFKAPYSLAKHCASNNLPYAIKVNSIKEALYANALSASYIIAEIALAKELQSIADNYLWDTKVLAIISNDDDLETIAKASIDGAIYQNHIKDQHVN